MADKTINVLVPVFALTTLVIEHFTLEYANIDKMTCDGCRNEMGPENPKGFFRVKDGWYKLCHKCCVIQGFIKIS